MSTVRPAGLPSVPAKPAATPASGGAATRSAFFQAALGEAAPTRPVQSAASVQMQAQTQASPQRQAPARPFVQPDAQPQKILRPGSLLNIVV
ncbi:MAG: hypothetical protein KKC14_10710 [Alphaproteobacteria bacterium]|nr:hypothetical protein [Alphaproteobacteria bacterium]